MSTQHIRRKSLETSINIAKIGKAKALYNSIQLVTSTQPPKD